MRLYGLGRILITRLGLLVIAVASSTQDRRQNSASCDVSKLTQVLPDNAKIERLEALEAGSTYGEGTANLAYPIQPTNLPALCAVTIAVASSATSSYRIGLFLPAEWNNRFLVVGNGGFGGGINWIDMGAGVQYGSAVVSTDTGHSSVVTDGSWAFDNPEGRTDWGWRSIHGSVVLGKLLVQAYYDRPIAYSYYSGCSTGGRQGLKEMQMFPSSFDGVLVGAAAWYTSHLNNWATQVASYNWPADDDKHIDWHLLPAIADEIVKQCDGIDGVVDNVISLPGQCNVNFDALSCERSGANQSACITASQTQTLKNVYSDWRTPAGELLYKGLIPGSEDQMYLVLNYSEASPYGIGYARYFVLNNESFSLADFNDTLVSLADKINPGNATADNYNLTSFRDRGGKMLMYHGQADGLVPLQGSTLYYDRVVEKMGGNLTATQDFFRYFMVPGMQHCWASPVDAPWAFGAPSQASMLGNDTWSVPGFKDAQHDILLALMDWVEKNITTDQIVATTWNKQKDASSGILRQRPLCPYPQMARWDGDGDSNEAASWTCGGDVRTSTTVPTSTSVPTSEAHHFAWQSSVTVLAVIVVLVTIKII
ncbi:putative ferulic acid Esterase/Feruloyl esterase [Xylaria arbuscula]|nr:putative ferulic acid Esterase/Feruloyl esterase [Xylaria arbuscula]